MSLKDVDVDVVVVVVVVVVVLNIFWAPSEIFGNAIFVPRVGVYSDVAFLVPVKQSLVFPVSIRNLHD